MSFPPGSWVMLQDSVHDAAVKRARTCNGQIVKWWTYPHPFVVMRVQGDLRLICPICRDPKSKDAAADPVEVARGDGEAAYDTFLHVEVALWARVAECAAYIGGPFKQPVAFRKHLREAYIRAFEDTWREYGLGGLPTA